MNVLSEMSSAVMDQILSGRFPLYSYIYTLRSGRRLTESASKDEIEKFVHAVSGKGLSTREIELLAHGYFRGNMRSAIEEGHLGRCLAQMRQQEVPLGSDLNDREKRVLSDLGFLRDLLRRLPTRLGEKRLGSKSFYMEAEVLVMGILSVWSNCEKSLRSFYDRCRIRESHCTTQSKGHGDQSHESGTKCESQYGESHSQASASISQS